MKIVNVIVGVIGFSSTAWAADIAVPAPTGGDDQALVQTALSSALPGDRVLFAPGAEYLHSNVLTVSTNGVELVGRGATLTANNPERAALIVQDAEGVTVGGLQLRATASARSQADRSCGLLSYRTLGLKVQGNDLAGFAGCGMMISDGSADFTVQGNVVHDTFADGIHMTDGAQLGVVRGNLVFDTGDDGIAVVSYGRQAPAVCSDIEIVGNVVLKDPSTAGRPGLPEYHGSGVTVDGGQAITIDNNYLQGAASACIRIVSSSAYSAQPVDNVVVSRNDLVSCNGEPSVTHGGLLVSARAGSPVRNVLIQGNAISDTIGAAAHVRVSPFTAGVLVVDNRFYDADASHRGYQFYSGAGAIAGGNLYNGAPVAGE